MANINLLPWRDELRKEQTRQFISVAIFSVILTAAILFLVRVNDPAPFSLYSPYQ